MISLVRILAFFFFFLFPSSPPPQIVARQMIAQGVPGAIVNVSSQASKRALRDHAVYCKCVQLQQCPLSFDQLDTHSHRAAACQLPLCSRPGAMQVNTSSSLQGSTKSALDMLSQVMAMELGPHKVGVCERKV